MGQGDDIPPEGNKMKECPKCGYQDPAYWRPRIFDFEVDFCTLGDLEIIMPELARKLKENKAGTTFDEGVYTYKRTGSNYVWRMWLPLFKLRGWAPKKYYDSAGSARTASHKTAFYYARIKRIVSNKDHHVQGKLGYEAQSGDTAEPRAITYKPEGKE